MDFRWQAEERSSWLLVHFRKSPAVLVGTALRDGGAHGGRAGRWNEQNKLVYCLFAGKGRWPDRREREVERRLKALLLCMCFGGCLRCVSECLSLSQGWQATITTG